MATQARLEARKLWVEALRSGEYKQGKKALSSNGGYCCLGVACETYNKHNTPLPTVVDAAKRTCYDGEIFYLPTAVVSWLGMKSSDGAYLEGGEDGVTSLADQNDKGKSFDEIADIIENNPKWLWKEDE